MSIEGTPGILLNCTRNGANEIFLEDFESEAQVENFILQPARESCRKMFSVGLSRFSGKLAADESVKTITNGIFLKSTINKLKSNRDGRENLTNIGGGGVESKALSDSTLDFFSLSSGTEESLLSSSAEDSSRSSTARDSSSSSTARFSSLSPEAKDSSLSPEAKDSSLSPEAKDSSLSPEAKDSLLSPGAEDSSLSPDVRDSSRRPNARASSRISGDSDFSRISDDSDFLRISDADDFSRVSDASIILRISDASYFSRNSDASEIICSSEARDLLPSSDDRAFSRCSNANYSSRCSDANYSSRCSDANHSSRCSDANYYSRCSDASYSSRTPISRVSSLSPNAKDASRSPDALHKMVRSILSSAVKCEADDHNNNIVITSHWCEICLVYDPNGANKHMEYHIAPTKLFLKRVLGYEEIVQSYGSHTQSQQLPLSILESCAINLVHFNCVFEKGLMLMQNKMIYKQKRWLNLLLLEVLDLSSSIKKFKISDIRNLPSFGDDGGFMKTRLLSTEKGDSTLFSYVNAVSEFVKLLLYINNKSFYSFNVLFESKLSEQEIEVAIFLKRTEKLSNILTIFMKGWKESLKPKREIEIQATEMLGMDLWQQMLDTDVGLDLKILLTSFGSFMASYHGGNISKAGIQAILLLISDMLNTLLPDMEDAVEFKFEYLHNLHVAFFPGGWLDLALNQPCFKYDSSVCLPILGVNKFLIFLEVFNWYDGYSLNLDPIYKTIHGLCFPTYSFEVFKMPRL